MTMSDKPKSGVPQYHAVETEINDNNEPPMPKPKRPRQRTLLKAIWFWEVVATITSNACIIAVIVIVAWKQDKPLSNCNIIIRLNATIAIFITAAK